MHKGKLSQTTLNTEDATRLAKRIISFFMHDSIAYSINRVDNFGVQLYSTANLGFA